MKSSEQFRESSGCPNCGWRSHQVGLFCPARGKECRRCGKLNQFAREIVAVVLPDQEN